MARPFDLVPISMKRLGPSPDQARAEVLFIHGAWRGAAVWGDLAVAVAAAGFGANLLELPGHGQPPWELPGFTSLKDYAAYASRAAAQLGRPILAGHSMGGWIAQKILAAADLPAVLLAPLPGSGLPLLGLWHFVRDNPKQVLGGLLGKPMLFEDAEGITEPARVTFEMGLGLTRARPQAGRQPRLLIAAGQDRKLPLGSMRRLARRLDAELIEYPDLPHELWQDDPSGRVIKTVLEFLERAAPRRKG